MKTIKLMIFSADSLFCTAASAQTIFTVAGNKTLGYSGDGGPAILARLGPSWIDVDAAGNLYIADNSGSRIRKVGTNDTITLFAGGATSGFSGDGGPATAAKLWSPSGLACDGAGNVFITDGSNHRIRKVNAAGIITTVAGDGTLSGGDGVPATATGMHPGPLAVDGSGSIYFDDGDVKIRKINATGIISTIAGNGITGYTGDGGPATAAALVANGLAVDASGNVFFADFTHHCVRKISVAGIITTIAGTGTSGFSGDGGPATAAKLFFPMDVAFDTKGNLYIVDASNSRVRKIDTAGIITTVVGNGTYCTGGCGDGGPATAAGFDFPYGIAIGATGSMYISDRDAGTVRKVKKVGVGITSAAPMEEGVLRIFPDPNYGSFVISVSSAENVPVQVHVTDMAGRRVKEVTGTTNKEMELQLNVPGGMYFVHAVTGEGRWSGKVVVR
jgi:hypothetical protein